MTELLTEPTLQWLGVMAAFLLFSYIDGSFD